MKIFQPSLREGRSANIHGGDGAGSGAPQGNKSLVSEGQGGRGGRAPGAGRPQGAQVERRAPCQRASVGPAGGATHKAGNISRFMVVVRDRLSAEWERRCVVEKIALLSYTAQDG